MNKERQCRNFIVIDYGLEDMEPKSERMSLLQWDGDPSGWRYYQ